MFVYVILSLFPCTLCPLPPPPLLPRVFSVQVEVDYVEEEVAISEYPLSAALTCAKLCSAFEEGWGIK